VPKRVKWLAVSADHSSMLFTRATVAHTQVAGRLGALGVCAVAARGASEGRRQRRGVALSRRLAIAWLSHFFLFLGPAGARSRGPLGGESAMMSQGTRRRRRTRAATRPSKKAKTQLTGQLKTPPLVLLGMLLGSF